MSGTKRQVLIPGNLSRKLEELPPRVTAEVLKALRSFAETDRRGKRMRHPILSDYRYINVRVDMPPLSFQITACFDIVGKPPQDIRVHEIALTHGDPPKNFDPPPFPDLTLEDDGSGEPE